ncbi:UNVERIFIED_CONTAM: hypothetical protein FKN15_051926 [Acipenser sinensis]
MWVLILWSTEASRAPSTEGAYTLENRGIEGAEELRGDEQCGCLYSGVPRLRGRRALRVLILWRTEASRAPKNRGARSTEGAYTLENRGIEGAEELRGDEQCGCLYSGVPRLRGRRALRVLILWRTEASRAPKN